MITLHLKTVLPGAALSLALLTGIAPVAFADPPGTLFQDFNAPQPTVGTLHMHVVANDNSHRVVVAPSTTDGAPNAAAPASGTQSGQMPHGK